MANTKTYVEIFRGDETSRAEPMEFLFKRNLYLVEQKCPSSLHYHFSDEDKVLECFFMLVPSFGAHFTLYEKVVTGGVLEFACHYGWSMLRRLLKASDYFDAMEDEIMKGRGPYFSLQRMVVDPDRQGGGLGSKCLGAALMKDADAKQWPVVLGTQDSRNLIFYGRLGFKVVRELTYVVDAGDDESYNYTVWFMVREPIPLQVDAGTTGI
eukprot:CAMPEP_0174962572 /NCGR_PEP_ID=MMETSP0004_2-20121128/4854_1 /TAXON_ID=420556 /ORGANISM="Ochromonas sp., Strain CCMP1393" /LENGTH=209 /DNA_ID=CAMNT_0016211111 /DNA_START=119 /DNA_END=748 /DNA_ORIENTATION=+